MTDSTKRFQAMKSALASLALARDECNNARHRCRSCGLTVYEERAEYQMREQLDAMCRKLASWINNGGFPTAKGGN
jgi:hypothetical protein